MEPAREGRQLLPDVLEGVFCLDFEASSLDRGGYPIEVGIANTRSNSVSAWLIRPAEEWLKNGVWDCASQALHGITLEQLEAEGIAVSVVAGALADELTGRRVLSDNPAFDGRWLHQLYTAAGAGRPPIILEELEIYAWHVAQTSKRLSHVAFRKAEIAARIAFPVMHRAGSDAQHNAEFLRQLRGESSCEAGGG